MQGMNLLAHFALPGLAAMALAGAAQGQPEAWPSRPLTVVVNVAPGSSVDAVARAVAGPLQGALGQPVVIDNRSGAAGNIGAEAVSQAVPDGHTLLASATSTVTLNPFIYAKMRFNPLKDLVPVAAAARITSLLVVRPGLPAGDVAGLIAYARSRAQPLTYASPGAGSVPHLAAEMFKAQAGIAASHVPYRGAAAALQDVLAGQVDFVFDPGTAIPHIRAGKVKLLAVATPGRLALFPAVPTLHELGLKGFDAGTTHGFYAPAGTPPDVVDRLNAEINRALASPAVREQLVAFGAEPAPMTPAQFRTLLENEARLGGALIKALGLRVD
jgi:tripartite-type tricarboxylate transporter receptor subunit TctC